MRCGLRGASRGPGVPLAAPCWTGPQGTRPASQDPEEGGVPGTRRPAPPLTWRQGGSSPLAKVLRLLPSLLSFLSPFFPLPSTPFSPFPSISLVLETRKLNEAQQDWQLSYRLFLDSNLQTAGPICITLHYGPFNFVYINLIKESFNIF